MTTHDSGSIIEGKYEVVERLGAGGMGEVLRARHIHLQELRVIKILRQDRAADPAAAQRFLQEARIATQIKHPNVAILYDYSRLPDGSFYMVWENIDGEDVGSWLRKKGPFPLQLAVELGIQTLRGLEAIHSAGVIHRDISPDNLMITRDLKGRHQVKIIDLGLAKNLSATAASNMEITQAGVFMGKLMYCSPEQASTESGLALDHRSDLYSFAAVLYEMVTAKPPFDSENQHGFIFKRLTEDPLPMVGRNRAVRVPEELDRAVRRGLERDRERRYPDAISFLQALVKVADRLRQVATQEVPVPLRETPARGIPTRPASGAQGKGRPSSASELSREERIELLAQIDRAAKKVSEATQLQQQVEQAISAGDLEAARAAFSRLDAGFPRQPGIHELRRRLEETERNTGRQKQSREAEALVERYLKERKQQLAQLALETLLEASPHHSRREEFESALAQMGSEAELRRRSEEALASGHEAIARGDLKAANRQLEMLQRLDPSGEAFANLFSQVAEAERQQESDDRIGEARRRVEAALAAHRLAEVERAIGDLAKTEVSRLVLDSYRARLAEEKARHDAQGRLQQFERSYRERIAAKNWLGAREVALELERESPDSPRPAQMYAEINRLEETLRRQQGIEQGIHQLETFLAQGRVQEAELALRIVLQMDPNHPRRAALEEQVRRLRGG